MFDFKASLWQLLSFPSLLFSHSVVSDSLQPHGLCNMPGFPALHHLPEFAQTHVHRVSDAIQQSHSLSSPLLLPSVFPSVRVFPNESALCIKWPKCWSFSFGISPSNEYSVLISFRIDWFDLLAVQGTLRSSPAPQFESINSLALNLYEVQLSHLNMTTVKTRALTIWTVVSKLMSLLFNVLSRLVIAFLQGASIF